MSEVESGDETQFVARDDDEETLWEVIEILAEKGERYRVRWAGIDPATNKPWVPSWVPKHDCTDDLVRVWKKKKEKKAKSKRVATKNKRGAPSLGGSRKGQRKARAVSEEIPVYEHKSTSGADPGAGPSRATRYRKRTALQDAKGTHSTTSSPGTSRSVSPSVDSTAESNHRLKRKRMSPQIYERAASPAGSSIEDVEPPRKIMKIGPPRGAKMSRAVVSSQGSESVPEGSTTGYMGGTAGSYSPQPEAAKYGGTRKKSSPASADHEEVVRKKSRTESANRDRRGKGTDVEDVDGTPGEHVLQEPLELSPYSLNRTPDSMQIASLLLEPIIAIPCLPDDEDGDSRREVIPETQLLEGDEEDGEDVFPEEDDNSIVLVAGTQRSSTAEPRLRDHTSNPSPLRLPSPPRSPSPKTDSRKSTENTSRAKQSKPLRPVPVISPSAFRPWLPHKPPSNWTQESIEDFSSPEQNARKTSIYAKPMVSRVQKLPFHTNRSSGMTTSTGSRTVRHGDHSKLQEDPDVIVRDMEEEYLDMTGGFPSPEHDSIETSGGAKVTGKAAQIESEYGHDQLTPSSTQQAVVGTQSQVSGIVGLFITTSIMPLGPTSSTDMKPSRKIVLEAKLGPELEARLKELQAQLEESRNIVSVFQTKLRSKEDEVAELRYRLQCSNTEKADICAAKEAAEKRANLLTAELEELMEQHDALLQLRPKDDSDSDEYVNEGHSNEDSSDREPRFSRAELVDKLLLAESRKVELEDLVQTLKEKGNFAAQEMYKSRLQKLEQELARWKGLSAILRQKDELTNDEIRRRAGEEPELRKKVEELVQRNEQLATEKKELEEELDQYEREEAEWAKEKDIWLEEIETLKGKAAELQAALQASNEEVIAWCTKAETREHAEERAHEKLAVSSRSAEDVWYVCKDVINGQPCGLLFESAQGLITHARTAHYGDLD